jgi:NCAIR mutase (PurE)-related protein
MDATDVDQLLAAVAAGEVAPDDAARRLARLELADLGEAQIDHHRSLRQGFPEAIYGPGKSATEVERITIELLDAGTGPVIVTRADEAQVAAVTAAARPHDITPLVTPTRPGATVVLRPAADRGRQVVVVTAGTADGPVADEAAAVLTALGLSPTMLRDRGVAGIHRLSRSVDVLVAAEAIIVVAGMEGALASVVGGLVGCPVIAVPTSVGYGAALEGVTALLAMLASCAAGVSVVGIDNGFGAAMAVQRALGGTR